MTAHRFALAAQLDRELEHLREEHRQHSERPIHEALSQLLRDGFRMALIEVGGER